MLDTRIEIDDAKEDQRDCTAERCGGAVDFLRHDERHHDDEDDD